MEFLTCFQSNLTKITITYYFSLFFSYSQSETIRNNDTIDFGQNVILGHFKDALLVIENRSEIQTTFELVFKEFQSARIPTPPREGILFEKIISCCFNTLVLIPNIFGPKTPLCNPKAKPQVGQYGK